MIKNTASQAVGAQMITAADGTPFTGSVTVAVTVDAGTQATGSVGSGACTHEGGGYHTYAPAQAETNGDLVAFTFSGTGAVSTTVQVYTRAATPDVNVASIAANAITATAIASDAITAAKLASDVTTEIQSGLATAAELAKVPKSDGTATWNATALASINAEADTALADYDAPTKAELDSAVAPLALEATAQSILTDTGTTLQAELDAIEAAVITNAAGVDIAADIIALKAETAAILADTNELQTDDYPTAIAAVKSDTAAILVDTADMQPKLGTPAASVSADIAAVKAQTAAIETDTQDLQSRLPAALTGDGNMKADALKFDGTSPVQTAGKLWVLDGSGNAIASASALQTVDDELATVDTVVDAIKVSTDKLDDTLEDDAGTYRFTTNALEQAPTGGSAPSAADIADAVWDEDLTGHTTTDSAGDILGNVATGSPPTAAAIADAVWDEATSGHTTSGTFGEQLKTDVDAILADTNELQTDDYPTSIAAVKSDTAAILTDTADMQPKLGTPAASVSADIAAVKAETASILADTNELQADDYPTTLAALATASSIAALNNLSAAQVNAEVDTALADYDPPTRTEATSDKDEILTVLGTPAISTIAADIADVRAGVDNVETDTQDIQSRIPASLVSGRMDASVGAMAANTVTASALASDAVSELAIPTATENADALLGRTISGGADGGRDVRSAMRMIRNKVSISGGTMTVTEEDDTTAAWTAAVTTTSGDPISAVDPS